MKLRTSLMIAPLSVSAVLLLCLVSILLVMVDYERKVQAYVTDSQARETQLESVKRDIGDTNVELYRTMALVSGLTDDDVKKRRDALPVRVREIQGNLKATLNGQGAEASAAAGELDKALVAFVQKADTAIDVATADPNMGVAALQSADAERVRMLKALDGLVQADRLNKANQLKQLEASLMVKGVAIAVVGLLSGVCALGFAWWMQRRIVGDLRQAVEAADRVAEGHFDTRLQVDRGDEIGQLQAALARMVAQLSTSINTVQLAALSIGHASNEIATGNLDLSRRTESTATQLQSTASSMVELTTTVRQTADAARSADGLAQAATQAARKGGEVMQQVVSNMAEIDQASRKINEIISVIDSIAFQTNILALNAAVEAARAGEQGKGFAVVAGEVRTLAQRSANAAREIKDLIHTSTDRVGAGTQLVQDAGRSMADIVSGVERVTQIISEITEAADMESQGIGQVTGAVNELDQMTQQNAALVEQSAAAAESLKEQVASLSGVVGRFRLG